MATRSTPNLPDACYIAIYSRSNFKYLTLLKDGQLTFTASQKARLASHEVVYRSGLPDGVVLLRCANGRFWRLNESDLSIRVDCDSIPGVADIACHLTTVMVREGVRAFRCVRNGKYAKRYTDTLSDSYSAIISRLDVHCEVEVSSASDTALTLPRHLMLKGKNDKFMATYWERYYYWQKFHKSSLDLSCIYEVAPLLDRSLSLRSIHADRFVSRSPNWIWADSTSPISKVDCHYEPVKLSNTMLALKSTANNQYLKRYTDYWEDCLCAVGTTSTVHDPTTHLIMSEAVSNRTLSNIRYVVDLVETSDIELLLVGEGALQNNTPNPADLQVAVTLKQSVTEHKSWSNSVTLSLGVMTKFQAGVPFAGSVSGEITVSSSYTHTSEFGTSINSVEFQTTYTVPQVPPGVTARVKVQCQKAKCRVPFTYTMKDTRIDGVDLPSEDRIDGIYDGANAFDVRAIASYEGTRQVPTESTLPVHVRRGSAHLRTQK